MKLRGSWQRLVCSSEVTILHKVMKGGIPSRDLKDVREESTCTVGGGVAARGKSSAKALSGMS